MMIQGFTDSFKLELASGLHVLAGVSPDQLKIALYTEDAALDARTTSYTTVGEVVDALYMPGGVYLMTQPAYVERGVLIIPVASVAIPVMDATVRGALVYNETRGGASVAVLDFGGNRRPTNMSLAINMPPQTAETALLRIQ